MNLLKVAHTIWEKYINNLNNKELCLVDATCGGGNDALFLSQMPYKSLHLIDIQEEAIKRTRERLPEDRSNIFLHKRSHSDLSFIKDPIDLIVYNLGYLPGSDKEIISTPETTVASLNEALSKLSSKGLISIMIYTGHPGGLEEKAAIFRFIKDLPKSFQIFHTVNPLKSTCPELITIYSK